MAKRENGAPFKRGDIVQYCASLDPADESFRDVYAKHETSIGIIQGGAGKDYRVAWISHNFPLSTVGRADGWSDDVLLKIGHVDLPPEGE